MDKLQEYRTALVRLDELSLMLQEYRAAFVRLDELSLMLGETLRLTRIGWDCIDGEKSDEAILGPINQIAKQVGEAIPKDIKCTRPHLFEQKEQ